ERTGPPSGSALTATPAPQRSWRKEGEGGISFKNVSSVRVASEASPERLELAHYLAAVAAGARGHQLDAMLRPVSQRPFHGIEPPSFIPGRQRRRRALAHRQVEARLRAGERAAQRGIERDGAEAPLNDKIPIGL